MASYVYMKVLESSPSRYDRGIRWLSAGRSEQVKARIAADFGGDGVGVLEIGSGTGTLSLLLARGGARVTGFDVSGPMLEVARQKVRDAGLHDRIELTEMGVAGMDHFPDASFDLVASTFVFSELSPDEQTYALHHAFRTLKSGGHLALADEVRPTGLLRRVGHLLVRIPLAVITFLLTQTSTRAVEGLEAKAAAAGFTQLQAELQAGGSFLYLTAKKE